MPAPQKSARPAVPGTGKPFECQVCGRRVADKRSLKQHMMAAHPLVADDVSPQYANAEARR